MIWETSFFLYYSKSISDEEFLTLYGSYSSKNPDFPYSAYPKFDYDQIDESECLAEFRVHKQDMTSLANVLRLPATICCHQRITCDRTEALCMLLKCFSYACRYSDMIHHFARPVPEISMITNAVIIFFRAMVIESHIGILIYWVCQCYRSMQMLSMQKVHLLTIALGSLMEQSDQFLALANTKEWYTIAINGYIHSSFSPSLYPVGLLEICKGLLISYVH